MPSGSNLVGTLAPSRLFRGGTDDSATDNLGMTEICDAPCVDTVTLNLAAGDYFFRCEVHPSIMTGALIVQ